MGALANSAPPVHTRRLPQLADLKILILEDDVTVRGILTQQCQRWGMQPQAMENSAQAMELLRTGLHFDMALVDVTLPGQDGAVVA